MNRPIRILAVFSLVLLVGLLANITFVQYVQQKAYNARSGNERIIQAAYSRQRGQILAGQTVIAQSVKSNDQFAYQRSYPAGTAQEYAPVTGFYSYEYGATGLEQSQNAVLSGDDDRLFYDRLSNLLSNTNTQGGNVQTTIDPAIQDAAWNGLKALGPGVQGAAVAIEPATGKILALVSTPSYDPNQLATHNFTNAKKTWAALNGNPDQPTLNRASYATLPPGSTFKLVTAAAALQNLKMTPDSLVSGARSLAIPGTNKPVVNEDNTTCGNFGRDQVTLQTALDWSCNVAFAQTGIRLTNQQLTNQAQAFGFNSTPFTELQPYSSSKFPTVTDKAFRALASFGQYNVTATPLQMAMVSAAIANGGVLMKPYLVSKLTSATLDVVSRTTPQTLSTPMTAVTARSLTQMMVDVVNNGTGRSARIGGVSVAGKTGTAQSDPSRPPYAWFTSFAPADNPKIAVAVLVQKSGTARNDIAGGLLCAPIARAMMQAALNETVGAQ